MIQFIFVLSYSVSVIKGTVVLALADIVYPMCFHKLEVQPIHHGKGKVFKVEAQTRCQNVCVWLFHLVLALLLGRYFCPGFIEEVPEARAVKGPASIPDRYVAKLGSDPGVLIVH